MSKPAPMKLTSPNKSNSSSSINNHALQFFSVSPPPRSIINPSNKDHTKSSMFSDNIINLTKLHQNNNNNNLPNDQSENEMKRKQLAMFHSGNHARTIATVQEFMNNYRKTPEQSKLPAYGIKNLPTQHLQKPIQISEQETLFESPQQKVKATTIKRVHLSPPFRLPQQQQQSINPAVIIQQQSESINPSIRFRTSQSNESNITFASPKQLQFQLSQQQSQESCAQREQVNILQQNSEEQSESQQAQSFQLHSKRQYFASMPRSIPHQQQEQLKPTPNPSLKYPQKELESTNQSLMQQSQEIQTQLKQSQIAQSSFHPMTSSISPYHSGVLSPIQKNQSQPRFSSPSQIKNSITRSSYHQSNYNNNQEVDMKGNQQEKSEINSESTESKLIQHNNQPNDSSSMQAQKQQNQQQSQEDFSQLGLTQQIPARFPDSNQLLVSGNVERREFTEEPTDQNGVQDIQEQQKEDVTIRGTSAEACIGRIEKVGGIEPSSLVSSMQESSFMSYGASVNSRNPVPRLNLILKSQSKFGQFDYNNNNNNNSSTYIDSMSSRVNNFNREFTKKDPFAQQQQQQQQLQSLQNSFELFSSPGLVSSQQQQTSQVKFKPFKLSLHNQMQGSHFQHHRLESGELSPSFAVISNTVSANVTDRVPIPSYAIDESPDRLQPPAKHEGTYSELMQTATGIPTNEGIFSMEMNSISPIGVRTIPFSGTATDREASIFEENPKSFRISTNEISKGEEQGRRTDRSYPVAAVATSSIPSTNCLMNSNRVTAIPEYSNSLEKNIDQPKYSNSFYYNNSNPSCLEITKISYLPEKKIKSNNSQPEQKFDQNFKFSEEKAIPSSTEHIKNSSIPKWLQEFNEQKSKESNIESMKKNLSNQQNTQLTLSTYSALPIVQQQQQQMFNSNEKSDEKAIATATRSFSFAYQASPIDVNPFNQIYPSTTSAWKSEQNPRNSDDINTAMPSQVKNSYYENGILPQANEKEIDRLLAQFKASNKQEPISFTYNQNQQLSNLTQNMNDGRSYSLPKQATFGSTKASEILASINLKPVTYDNLFENRSVSMDNSYLRKSQTNNLNTTTSKLVNFNDPIYKLGNNNNDQNNNKLGQTTDKMSIVSQQIAYPSLSTGINLEGIYPTTSTLLKQYEYPSIPSKSSTENANNNYSLKYPQTENTSKSNLTNSQQQPLFASSTPFKGKNNSNSEYENISYSIAPPIAHKNTTITPEAQMTATTATSVPSQLEQLIGSSSMHGWNGNSQYFNPAVSSSIEVAKNGLNSYQPEWQYSQQLKSVNIPTYSDSPNAAALTMDSLQASVEKPKHTSAFGVQSALVTPLDVKGISTSFPNSRLFTSPRQSERIETLETPEQTAQKETEEKTLKAINRFPEDNLTNATSRNGSNEVDFHSLNFNNFTRTADTAYQCFYQDNQSKYKVADESQLQQIDRQTQEIQTEQLNNDSTSLQFNQNQMSDINLKVTPIPHQNDVFSDKYAGEFSQIEQGRCQDNNEDPRLNKIPNNQFDFNSNKQNQYRNVNTISNQEDFTHMNRTSDLREMEKQFEEGQLFNGSNYDPAAEGDGDEEQRRLRVVYEKILESESGPIMMESTVMLPTDILSASIFEDERAIPDQEEYCEEFQQQRIYESENQDVQSQQQPHALKRKRIVNKQQQQQQQQHEQIELDQQQQMQEYSEQIYRDSNARKVRRSAVKAQDGDATCTTPRSGSNRRSQIEANIRLSAPKKDRETLKNASSSRNASLVNQQKKQLSRNATPQRDTVDFVQLNRQIAPYVKKKRNVDKFTLFKKAVEFNLKTIMKMQQMEEQQMCVSKQEQTLLKVERFNIFESGIVNIYQKNITSANKQAIQNHHKYSPNYMP